MVDTDDIRYTEWSNLFNSGDASALVAVFREAASCSKSSGDTLMSISQFLESHLFTSALEVDMQLLLSSGAEVLAEATSQQREGAFLDSRDVLTELLSVGPINGGRALASYLRLIRATVRQLFLDTLRRKRGCGSACEQLRMTRAVMAAWYPELESNLFHRAELLILRDATPELVRTVNPLNAGAKDTDGVDEDDSGEEEEGPRCRISDYRSESLEALSSLTFDLVSLMADTRKTVPLLLLLRATVEASQPYTKDSVFLRRSATCLRDWSLALCPPASVEGHDVPIPPPTLESTPREGLEAGVGAMRRSVAEVLLALIAGGDVVSFLLDYVEGMFHGDLMESLSYEDSELGLDPRGAKVIATMKDLKCERDAVCILSDADDEEDFSLTGQDTNSVDTYVSLQRVGALLTLCDVMTFDSSHSFSLLSNSPQTFLFLTGKMILEAVKSPSLTVVMLGLTFLAIVLTFVTPYSIHIPGEYSDTQPLLSDVTAEGGGVDGSLKFSTRKFELMFELAKALVSLSTTCPSEGPRLVSRAVFTLMVRRCSFDLRLRVCSSFLVLTPFASVCSLMLHALRREWGDGDWQTDKCRDNNTFLLDKLPCFLLQAQRQWMRKLQIHEVSFVDPMVQSINFMRCIISEDARRGSDGTLFRRSANAGKIRVPGAGEEVECRSPWERCLRSFLQTVAPQLRKVVAESSGTLPSHVSVHHLASLSPLDCFSMSMALDGLEERVEAVKGYQALPSAKAFNRVSSLLQVVKVSNERMLHSEIIVTDGEERGVPEGVVVTPPGERRSSVYLTKYEVARIIGERARQIINGMSGLPNGRSGIDMESSFELAESCSNPFAASVDPIHVTKLELLQGRIPMIVRRMWPDGRTEWIPVNELKVDKTFLVRQDVRNVAVIAHVDHGKTTLVDEMLKQSGTLVGARNRVMDSKDQEKERGITILAKNTAIVLPAKAGEPQRRINIVDTPGHLDFSGEVERALQMVEGIILLVDAKEGVRPGTRYVLRKSLAMRLKAIVCLNKIDKDDTNIRKTEDGVQDLFLETAEDDSQLDIKFLYGSGRDGYMNDTPKKEGTLHPLFQTIFDVVPAPQEGGDSMFQMLVAQVEFSESTEHRTAIGRIFKGSVSVGDVVTVALEGDQVDALVKGIQLFVGVEKISVQTASFGDICVLTLQEPIGQKVPVRIGSTVCSQGIVDRFPYRRPDEPTYSLVMQASEAGWRMKEAAEQLGTIAVLQKRLEREALVNTALQLVGLGTPHIKLMGRGPLHLSVIIEDMRREGYEFEVQAPRVMTKNINGEVCEPYERVNLEFRESLVGEMVSFFSSKMAEIGEITQLSSGRVSMECLMPVRFLSHVPLRFHTLTGGDGVLNHSFDSYKPMTTADTGRETGALVATEGGEVTDWSLAGQAHQGRFFVIPGDTVHYGQIIGENTKTLFQNLGINVCKRNEQLGGMRANANDKAGKRKSSYVASRATFEECIAWVTDDELVTVTPKSIRMRLPNFNGKTTMRNVTKKK